RTPPPPCATLFPYTTLFRSLGQLLAEQDDNMLHKPYTQLEAAGLYREIKQVMAEDAARRKSATQFSSENQPGNDGPAKFAGPSRDRKSTRLNSSHVSISYAV